MLTTLIRPSEFGLDAQIYDQAGMRFLLFAFCFFAFHFSCYGRHRDLACDTARNTTYRGGAAIAHNPYRHQANQLRAVDQDEGAGFRTCADNRYSIYKSKLFPNDKLLIHLSSIFLHVSKMKSPL